MRAKLAGVFLACAASVLAVSSLPAGQEDKKKSEGLPPPQLPQPPQPMPIALEDDLSYFENVWGLKKRFFGAELWPVADRKLLGNRILGAGRFAYVLEFTRDIHNYDLEALQKVLFLPDGKLRHVFFDADNIAINSMATFGYQIHGEVSGVKGDVIRVIVEFGMDLDIIKLDPRNIQQARKMVVRRV